METGTSITLLTVGGLLLLGLLANYLSPKLHIPRVSLLIIAGIALGPSGFDVLPQDHERWYMIFSNIALLMIGFILGGKLSFSALRDYGREVFCISICEVLGVAALIFFGLLLLGVQAELALILAGIGPASDPAAVTNVLEGQAAKGRFSETLLGIVAIDDAWGLIAFSILLAVAIAVSGQAGWMETLSTGGIELGGALLIGLLLGMPAAWLTDHLRSGEPMQAEALGFIFICGGLAQVINASFILAAMIMGAVIVNTAKYRDQAFAIIREFEWPIMILFFVLAGSSLRIEKLPEIGFIGVAYIGLRILGLVAGAAFGGSIGKAAAQSKKYMGLAITPQAGVALGMALVGANQFPELKNTIIPVAIGTTVVFEIIGPVFTLLAVNLSGESGRNLPEAQQDPD